MFEEEVTVDKGWNFLEKKKGIEMHARNVESTTQIIRAKGSIPLSREDVFQYFDVE